MSLWEFGAARAGWQGAQGTATVGQAPSDAEWEEAKRLHGIN